MLRKFGFLLALGLVAGMAGSVNAAPILWLEAGTNVSTSGSTVTGWADAGTSVQKVSGTVGTPTLVTGVLFPNGTTHNVVTFVDQSTPGNQAGDGLMLNNAADLSKQSLNIFVVGSTSQNQLSGEFLTDYHNSGGSHGWAAGNSDSAAGQLKWFTGPDGGDTLGNTTSLVVNPNQYYSINMSVQSTVQKDSQTTTSTNGLTLTTVNGSPSPETSYGNGTNQIPYDGSEQASIGFLNFVIPGAPNGFQFLSGSIAEILVYDDTGLSAGQIAAETAAANAYINQKYFLTPEPSSVVSLALGGLALVGGSLLRRRKVRSA